MRFFSTRVKSGGRFVSFSLLATTVILFQNCSGQFAAQRVSDQPSFFNPDSPNLENAIPTAELSINQSSMKVTSLGILNLGSGAEDNFSVWLVTMGMDSTFYLETLTADGTQVLGKYPYSALAQVIGAQSPTFTFRLKSEREKLMFSVSGLKVRMTGLGQSVTSNHFKRYFHHDWQRPSVGLVIPDLLLSFVQPTYRPAAENLIRLNMAKKAVRDAAEQGARIVNIFAVGYFPQNKYQLLATNNNGISFNDLELWQKNPKLYWSRIDDLVYEVAKNNMGLSIRGWSDLEVFATLAGEKLTDILKREESKSYQLYARYWTEFLNRYKDATHIVNYGAPNEMNLHSDLDLVKRCYDSVPEVAKNQSDSWCSTVANFTTAEMNAFGFRAAKLFKSLSPLPFISNHALPRSAAYNLMQKPEWAGGTFKLDTIEEFTSILNSVQEPYDFFDIHVYNDEDGKSLQRFGFDSGNPYGTDLIKYVGEVAAKAGKKTFMSEFGDIYNEGLTERKLTKNLISDMTALNISSLMIWGYQFFQFTTYDFQANNNTGGVYDFEPGRHQALFELMRDRNLFHGHPVKNFSSNIVDTLNPQTLISYPYNGQNVALDTLINVLASDNSGKIQRVELSLDGKLFQTLHKQPFKTRLFSAKPLSGKRVIKATAFDFAGKSSSHSITVDLSLQPTPVKITQSGLSCESLDCVWVQTSGMTDKAKLIVRKKNWEILNEYSVDQFSYDGDYSRVSVQLKTEAELYERAWNGLVVTYGNGTTWDSIEVAPGGKTKISAAGSGCSDLNCIWITGENFTAKTFVEIRDTNWKVLTTIPTDQVVKNLTSNPQLLTLAIIDPKQRELFGTTGLVITVNNGSMSWDSIEVRK